MDHLAEQPSSKPGIFISYASEDQRLAKLLKDEIERLFGDGFEIFVAFDYESISPGADWLERIFTALHSASVFLVIVTANSVSKPWVNFEIGGISLKGGRLVRLLAPGIPTYKITGGREQILHLDSAENMARLEKLLRGLCPKQEPSFDSEDFAMRVREVLKQDQDPQHWAQMTREAVARYLRHAEHGKKLQIRLVSYTGETTARDLPKLVLDAHVHGTYLEIQVLLRSERQGFPARPLDAAFNQWIRRTITEAKGAWYKWQRDLEKQGLSGLIALDIRDYASDPGPKAMMLGESEAFFGIYSVNKNEIAGHREINRANDWVAADTQMAHFDGTNQRFITNIVRWFDSSWKNGTERANERYRYKFSEELCALAERKAVRDPLFREALQRLRSNDDFPLANLTLPGGKISELGPTIDVIGPALLLPQGKSLVPRCVLFCELREPDAEWEGGGKTNTALYLSGLQLALQTGGQAPSRRLPHDVLADLVCAQDEIHWVRSPISANQRLKLFASDFVWAWIEDGRLMVTRPAAERVWGLWDSSRFLLRSTAERTHPGDKVHRKRREIQDQIFLRLSAGELLERYTHHETAQVAMVVVVAPQSPDPFRLAQPEELRNLLVGAFESGAHHPSDFWKRDATLAHEEASKIFNGLTRDFPAVYVAGSPVLFEFSGKRFAKHVLSAIA